jgi:hypothetical protein
MGSQTRVPSPSPATESHGRTDGRTDDQKGLRSILNLKAVDAGAHTDDIAKLGDIITSGSFWPTGERHPVVRACDREPIPYHVRSAVWFRDSGKCELCGDRDFAGRGLAWHLDHITPWSAGGSDKSTNLRVLCEPHNTRRSNYQDPTERVRRGVTWWCLNCFEVEWMYTEGEAWLPECPRHGWSKRCRVRRGVEWSITNEHGDWHRRRAIDPDNASLTIAYCAHCDAPGLTDVIL